MIALIILFQATLVHLANAGVVEQPHVGRNRACFPPHGCYSNDGLFGHMKVLPQAPNSIDTTFRLYHPSHPDGMIISENNLPTFLANSTIDLYALVHGFGNFPPWILPMKDELIKKGVTVIVVDWTAGSRFPNYYQAASNTRIVGSLVADLLTLLVNKNLVRKESITLVGFSLGAHVCGFAGKKFPNLPRIIGLDPAGPLFAGYAPETRLDSSDANFVQCIHTNGLKFLYGGLGTLQPLGHVDFYPNGGMVQVGCALSIREVLVDLWRFSAPVYEGLTCSHGRAPELFIETIRRSGSEHQCEFKSIACDSTPNWYLGSCFQCDDIGHRTPMFGFETRTLPAVQGQFYFSTLGTKEHDLFCGSQYGISVQSDREVKGTLTITAVFKMGSNDTFTFLTESETLEPKSQVVKLFALTQPFDQVEKVIVLYERYSSWLWADGAVEWVINSATVTSLSCNEQIISIKQLIVDKQPLEIQVSA